MNITESEDIRNKLLVARLPAMPQILLKLMDLCQDEDAGMAEIAKLVANDAGMASRIMNIANSAAYQRGVRKVGLVQALNTLGLDLIKTLVICESVFQTFNGFPHTSSTDLRGFWKHSLSTAVLARDIAKNMKYMQVEEAYLAGLLHDVGRLALLAASPEAYRFNFHNPDDGKLCGLELRTIHISHPEAGAWLIERWDMDSFLADSVLYHHEDSTRVINAHPLIRIVHLANIMAIQPADEPLPAGAGALCKISDADLLAIQQAANEQVLKAADLLGIDLSGVDELATTNRQAESQAVAPVDPLQQRMSEEIRNRALVSELSQLFARQEDQPQLLESVRQNARILFDLEDTAVFMLNVDSQTLVGTSMGEQRQRLADFSIPLSAGGVIAESALQKRASTINSSRDLLNITEEQLLHAFGADCLLCVPIASGARCWGMLFAGVPCWRAVELLRQEKFLLAFGTQAANALSAAANDRSQVTQQIDKLREEQQENSRKVAHEVNNPLSIIKNYLGVLDDKLARQQPIGNELSILNEEIDRVGSIIKEFAGVKPPAQTDSGFDINRVINDIVRLFRESKYLPPTVKITSRVVERPCQVSGAPETLKQILVNLIKNAVEALPQGGHIEIINIGQTRVDGQDYFGLTIRDSGPGLPPEVMAKLFSPVRSTKAGENRGLGLSITHGLVKKLNGRIECRSSRMGTSFEILLPLHHVKIPV